MFVLIKEMVVFVFKRGLNFCFLILMIYEFGFLIEFIVIVGNLFLILYLFFLIVLVWMECFSLIFFDFFDYELWFC